MIYLLSVLLLSFAHGQTPQDAEDWTVLAVNHDDQRLLGADVIAIIGNRKFHVAQVNVSVYRDKILSRTEPQWQDFVVAHLHSGKNHIPLKRVLLHNPVTAYFAEISYNLNNQAMITKVLVMPRGGDVLMFRYDDDAQTYSLYNKILYHAFFQDLAFGKHEAIVSRVLALKP